MRRFPAIALVLVLLTGGGCEGSLLAGPAGPSGAPRDPGPGPACAPDTIVLGTAPMRRLSNVEYVRTLGDLFPGIDVALPDLPADTTASGFENDARALGPSDVRVSRWEEIAFRHGTAVTATPGALAAFLPCAAAATDDATERACGESLVRDFGARAWRRPLTSDEAARLDTFFETQRLAIDFEAAVQLTVTAILQAPAFLYRLEVGGGEGAASVALAPYEMASRLSYFLWESMPDAVLFDAAARGELATAEQIEAQARRMVADPRARGAVVDFHRQWLEMDRILADEHLGRVPDLYPTWNEALRDAVREEEDRFVEAAIFGEGGGTLSSLFLSRRTAVNASLAELYGVPGPADDATWAEVELPEGERAGLLTRVGFLASHAHSGNASPPLRGVFVMERLLCEPRPSPPASADTTPPVPMPGAGPRTNRQLFEERTAPPLCQGCHVRIDGFGYGFEHYDAIGAYRDLDNTLPVDASGNLSGTDVDGPYVGAIELSEALAESRTVEDCATRQWMRYALGRSIEREDECFLDRMQETFSSSGGDVRALMVAIVTSPEFRNRPVVPASE